MFVSFLAALLQERVYHINPAVTPLSENTAPIKPKPSHRLKRNLHTVRSNIAVNKPETSQSTKHWDVSYYMLRDLTLTVKLLAQAKKYEHVNRGKDEHVHLLSGIVKCPVCGAGMYGNKSIKHKADGTKYKDFYYYGCKHRTMI